MFYKHGQARRSKKTPEYRAWRDMKQRCQNPKCQRYRDYGGRGIRVCDRWQDFRNFYTDMGKRPGSSYSIDRIDNNGNYELSNCRWSTTHEQRVNSRPASRGPNKQHLFCAYGPNREKITQNNQSEFARKFGLNTGCISECLHGIRKQHKGWRFQRINQNEGGTR